MSTLKNASVFCDINLPCNLGIRKIRKEDQPFLEQLFFSSRPHLALIDMPEAFISSLVSQQYMLQQAHYQTQWPDTEKLIITLANSDIGKIITALSDTSLRIVDLALLQHYRGKGIGTSILRSLQQFARQHSLPLKLSVDNQNSLAKKLYLSIGFQITGHTETHDSMIWMPHS